MRLGDEEAALVDMGVGGGLARLSVSRYTWGSAARRGGTRGGRGTHQKVAKDPTWTPYKAICPSLYPALVLVKDEHCSALYHAPFPLYQSACNSRDHASSRCLEYEQGIKGGLDVPPERRVEVGRWWRGVGHCEKAV